MSDGSFLKLAVIGDPVEHSASPALFGKFFDGAGVAGSYEAIRVPAGDGARAIAELRAQGYRGLNVTTPLKEEALAACDRVVDPEASIVDSANVLLFQDDGIHGFNTDAGGALHVVTEILGVEENRENPDLLKRTRILVLGVGPTARAVMWKLVRYGADVSVWNRSADRARSTALRYKVGLWEGEAVDIIFSTLPPDGELDDHVARAARSAPTVIDANYGPRATLATRLGRDVIDGMLMLRNSALESFRLFSIPRGERFESGIAQVRLLWT
jgi:shikimate dehydrogenase